MHSNEGANTIRRLIVRASVFIGLVVNVCLGLRSAAYPQQNLSAFDQKPYTHPQRLVVIAPGRTLNLYCTGHGTPAVILDSGWGGPTTAWAYVQPAISRFTQVCSYDRAGQGFSDAGPLPRDTNALVADLHALLGAAHISFPYVFVGHSLAGLDGILFADRYRNELAAMVLVDPAFPHQGEAMSRVPGVTTLLKTTVPDFTPCLAAARAHRIPSSQPLIALCLNHDPSFTPSLVSALDRTALRPDHWTNLDSEVKSFNAVPGLNPNDSDSRELDKASKKLGSLPLIVLTAGDRINLTGMSSGQAESIFKIWNHGHEVIAAIASHGRNELVPHSSHYIQFYQPATVINAIHDVVGKYRSNHCGRRSAP